MKKPCKILLSVVLSAVFSFSVFSMTACSKKTPTEPVDPGTGTTTPPPSEDSTGNPGTGTTTPPPSEDSTGDPEPESPKKIPTDKYDAIVASMVNNKNYTYSVTADGTTTLYEIDGDKVCFYEIGSDTQTIIYTNDGYSYQLKYETDGYFHKTHIAAYNVDDFILNDMKAVIFTLYDENTKEYTAKLDGETYAMTVSDEAIIFKSSKKIIGIEAFNQTNIPIIEDSRIKDDTSEKPVTPEDPVASEKIYTVENGVRVYNSKLLGETLKAAMNAEAENGKTVLNKFSYGTADEVKDILYVSTAGNVIEIGTIIGPINTRKKIELFKIEKSSVENIGSGKDMWITAITQQARSFDLGYELIRIDYDASTATEHQAVLKEVFKKALDKVAVDGVQLSSYYKKGEPQPRYANSEVLTVFEFEDGLDGQAGLDLGYTHRKGFAGIIKDANGQHIFVRMNIATSNLTSLEDTVLNKENSINNKYMVYKMTKELELDEQFFQSE